MHATCIQTLHSSVDDSRMRVLKFSSSTGLAGADPSRASTRPINEELERRFKVGCESDSMCVSCVVRQDRRVTPITMACVVLCRVCVALSMLTQSGLSVCVRADQRRVQV